MLQLQQNEQQIEQLQLKVAVVTFESSQQAKLYLNDTRLPWPLIIDDSRELYAAYGMTEGSYWNILGPESWFAYGKLMLRGRMPHQPTGNINQLGGDVLIDPRGIIQLHHTSSNPADRPAISDIFDMLPS